MKIGKQNRSLESTSSYRLGSIMLLPLLFAIASPVFAQKDVSREGQQADRRSGQNPDELKTQEQILDELKFRRAQVTGLESEVKAQLSQINTLQELVTALKERGDFYKQAATDRSGANLLEAERDRTAREQAEEFRAEIARLRSENDKLRRSRDRRTIISFALGAGAGAFLRR